MTTPRAVVLVEGNSDRVALQTLATREGRDLAAEEGKLRHGLAAAGLPAALDPGGLADLGFHKCTADLEDELIRALGVEAVEAVIEAAGEARSLQLLAGMPAQRDWTREAVLRRFLGVRSGRKARYAALLVEALEPRRVPEPLAAVLARV